MKKFIDMHQIRNLIKISIKKKVTGIDKKKINRTFHN